MKYKRLVVSVAVTVLEFAAFLVWGLNMDGGDAMAFGLITTYFLFPISALILSAYLAYENIVYVIPFTVIMFAAQNSVPFFVYGTFEVAIILCFTFIPASIGTLIGIGIKKFKR